jgi:DNA-binding transcriptional ArsR family regulator
VATESKETAPISGDGLEMMMESACDAAALLKALSHEGRLMIMCQLVDGEKSVSQLEAKLDIRQAAVSQQLARLRLEGLVESRRDGKTIYYSIADERPRRVLELMYAMYCKTSDKGEAT